MADDILVLINDKSGRAREEGADAIKRQLTPILEQKGDPRFIIDDVPVLMDAAKDGDARTVVSVGGDGTIAGISGALQGRDDAGMFIPLPYGTANLIPRDLGLSLDPEEALRQAISAPPRAIDYVEVGTQSLLHSAAFGTFAEMAEDRETYRDAPTQADRFGAAVGMFERFLDAQPGRYRVTLDGDEQEVETAAIFVANNTITGAQGGLPRRDTLDAGELKVYISRNRGVLGLLTHMIDAVAGQFTDNPEFDTYTARSVTVQTLDRELHFTIDGEPGRDVEDLTFIMHPRSLKVPDLR